MQKDTGNPVEELRVDGGAAANDYLMQFQSDILGAPVIRPAVTESTALGAAYLAGLGVGLWGSTSDLAKVTTTKETRFEPRLPASQAAALRGRWNEAVSRAKAWQVEPRK
jgi:glycerol kinase